MKKYIEIAIAVVICIALCVIVGAYVPRMPIIGNLISRGLQVLLIGAAVFAICSK